MVEVSALVECISTSHACEGWELVYAYLTGVGFLSLLIHESGNAKATETGKQQVGGSRLFCVS